MGGKYANSPIIEAAAPIENTLSQLSERGIKLPNLREVRDHLIDYPDLTSLVSRVCETTLQEFGSNSELSLEVYHDPEIEDSYLTLYVRLTRYDETVMKKIKGIRAEYQEQLVGKTGWFLLTTDFRPPRQ